MQTDIRITLQDLPYSEAFDARVREKVLKLEKRFSRLTACHVVLSEPHRHNQNPRSFEVRVNIAYPDGEIVVTRDNRDDVYILLREAFAVAERELAKKLGRRNARGEPHHGLAASLPPIQEKASHD